MKQIPSKRVYLRRKLSQHRYACESFVLLFGTILLLYAFWEFFTRYDAVDGMYQAYFKLVGSGDITLKRAIENLLSVPEARADFIRLINIGLCMLYAVFAVLTSRCRFGTYIVMSASIPLAFFPVTPLKSALCGCIFVASSIKLISILRLKHIYIAVNMKNSLSDTHRQSAPRSVRTEAPIH